MFFVANELQQLEKPEGKMSKNNPISELKDDFLKFSS